MSCANQGEGWHVDTLLVTSIKPKMESKRVLSKGTVVYEWPLLKFHTGIGICGARLKAVNYLLQKHGLW